MRVFLLIIGAFLFNSLAFASFDMNKNMRSAYSHIINLEFDAAKSLLINELNNNPDNGVIYLHENYIDFLSILIGEDSIYFYQQERFKNKRLKQIRINDNSSPYYLYIQAEIHLQWAFSRIKFNQYLKAAYEIQRAYVLIKENFEKFPDFTLNFKTLGLIHTLVGSIPKELQWVIKLIGIEGTVDMGIKELNQLLLSTKEDKTLSIYKTETLFLLSFLQMNYTDDKVEFYRLLKEIDDEYTVNYLLNFTAARLSSKLGMNDLTIKILKNRPDNTDKYPFHYLDYLLGMSMLYQLDSGSSKYFYKFLSNFSGKNYIKSAYQKLAWIHYLEQDIEKYKYYCQMITTNGKSLVDEDIQAERQVQEAIHIPHYLLKSRLLYDGGYYNKALTYIESINTFDDSNTELEHWYRKGRIFQALNKDPQMIISCFNASYNLGKHTSRYFAPMSALQIAIQYEKIGDIDNAKTYYRKCLNIQDFDYQKGIHRKARLGLYRVKNYN